MPGRRAPTPRRYAEAVFQLAVEDGQVDRWQQDLQTMVDITRSEGVVSLLESHEVSLADKLAAIGQVLPDLSPRGANLMALLAHSRALGQLPRIQSAFQDMVDRREGRVRATVITAVPLEPEQQEKIVAHLKDLWEKEVLLESRVDPSLLGGMVVRAGDHVIDGSARGRLQVLRRTIKERTL